MLNSRFHHLAVATLLLLAAGDVVVAQEPVVTQAGTGASRRQNDTAAVRLQGVEVLTTVTGYGKSRGINAVTKST